eukprot:5025896-Amphidinium_carterae.1
MELHIPSTPLHHPTRQQFRHPERCAALKLVEQAQASKSRVLSFMTSARWSPGHAKPSRPPPRLPMIAPLPHFVPQNMSLLPMCGQWFAIIICSGGCCNSDHVTCRTASYSEMKSTASEPLRKLRAGHAKRTYRSLLGDHQH